MSSGAIGENRVWVRRIWLSKPSVKCALSRSSGIVSAAFSAVIADDADRIFAALDLRHLALQHLAKEDHAAVGRAELLELPLRDRPCVTHAMMSCASMMSSRYSPFSSRYGNS